MHKFQTANSSWLVDIIWLLHKYPSAPRNCLRYLQEFPNHVQTLSLGFTLAEQWMGCRNPGEVHACCIEQCCAKHLVKTWWHLSECWPLLSGQELLQPLSLRSSLLCANSSLSYGIIEQFGWKRLGSVCCPHFLSGKPGEGWSPASFSAVQPPRKKLYL